MDDQDGPFFNINDGQEMAYRSFDDGWNQIRRRFKEESRVNRERDKHESSSPPPQPVRSMEKYDARYSKSTSRKLYIQRKDGGFGFTLRHFIVYPPEEGDNESASVISDPMDTIFVKSVKDAGPAAVAGLNIGDRIDAVNGDSVSGLSYPQVVQMIQKSRDMLTLTVVSKQDDILQMYFSDIAQNPETNKRVDSSSGLYAASSSSVTTTTSTNSTSVVAKSHWPASVCSSSSRESSPFSSKTSDSARDSVYGHSTKPIGGPPVGESVRCHYSAGVTGRMPRHMSGLTGSGSSINSSYRPSTSRREWENVYESINNERLKVPGTASPSSSGTSTTLAGASSSRTGSTEHVYAVPALASSISTSSTIGSGHTSFPNNSRDSLDSDSSLMAGFTSQQDDPLISKIKKDCERKEEFLKNQTYPAYLSSPPKDVDTNPYGIASLANTMPPPKSEDTQPKPKAEESNPEPAATKNFFMDIYAKELSRMQSASKSSGTTKKRNFDTTQFNTYGLPLGYRRGGNYYDSDNFSRNNFVIVGSRTLHCEPPQVYQPTQPPPPPACHICYGGPCTYGLSAYPPDSCIDCAQLCPGCSGMTDMTPYSHRPVRPNTLPGIQSFDAGRQSDMESPLVPLPFINPFISTPVRMHPDHLNTAQDTVVNHDCPANNMTDRDLALPIRRKNNNAEDEEEKNLRRISYLQATKEDILEPEENLANETGIAPTHVKKLKSIFSEKSEPPGPAPLPMPSSPKLREVPKTISASICDQLQTPSISTLNEGIKEGYLTCKVAVVDGKKATDRSWKTVYAVLKSKALYMYKDKKMAQDNSLEYEEKPVDIAESEVQVASDYTKRKNVFRVKTELGSEYLFQAENESLMNEWVNVINEAAMAIIVDERKDSNKLRKLTSFRNRSPTGQSPSCKNRKSSTDPVPTFKEKDKKNWKGKMVKQLKKMGGSGHVPLYPEGGSIGVPLDECPLCETENIPYLVKVCCDIVNERGLDMVGIYRVPGNNAAITYLTEQINKGTDHFALDDQRWQDVNVVSSLLKSFFRKLPEPLFTMEMYSSFIEASKTDQTNQRLDLLRKLIRDLPEIHFETLRFLTQHLCNVAKHAEVNKMEIRNLAIVFGPTLVRTTDDNMVSMVTDMSQQCRIIESLLSHWDFFFSDSDIDVDVKEDVLDDNVVTGVGNQSIMLANLQKLEDSGKISSPKTDVSAKDIVSSVIQAASRKMNRSVGKTSKKDNLSDAEDRSINRIDDCHLSESRRDSESVIHGALQIASAVPGIIESLSIGNLGDGFHGSGRDTPEDRPVYARQDSRGSIGQPSGGSVSGMSSQHMVSAQFMKRRGSLPVCQSKRGSICAYTGGAVCESMPTGEVCETRMAILKSEVSNGVEDKNSEIVTGKLNLVSVGTTNSQSSNTSTSVSNFGLDAQSSPVSGGVLTSSPMSSVLSSSLVPPITTNEYKFPNETYVGLDAIREEQKKKFSAETHAMMTRPVTESSSGQRSHFDFDSIVSSTEETSNGTGSAIVISPSLPEVDGSNAVSIHCLGSRELAASYPVLTSVTTPIPDTNPLEGGILMEDPYPTDAYDRLPGEDEDTMRLLSLPYRNSLPSLLDRSELPQELLRSSGKNFDTNKVVTKGTLQRLKQRSRTDIDNFAGKDQMDEKAEADSILSLSAQFDAQMRLLLDPHYASMFRASPEMSCKSTNFTEVDADNAVLSTKELLTGNSKKELDDAKNCRLKAKNITVLPPSQSQPELDTETKRTDTSISSRKSDLRRSGRVDPANEPQSRRAAVHKEDVVPLRQVNHRRPLKRSDSLTKKEKTALNLKTKEIEKENKVMKLRDQFEQSINSSNSIQNAFSSYRHNTISRFAISTNDNNAAIVSTLNTNTSQSSGKKENLDLNKLRKKLSDCKNRRIKRRHTVGGTKDFNHTLSKAQILLTDGDRLKMAKSTWDRLAPIISNHYLVSSPVREDRENIRWTWQDERPSPSEEDTGSRFPQATDESNLKPNSRIDNFANDDGRRHSLPDCGADTWQQTTPTESHV